MLDIKYGGIISEDAVRANIKKLINQVYKLLPIREEGGDWGAPLVAILEELSGMTRILQNQHSLLLPLLSKLEGLFDLTDEKDFLLYRKVIFENLSFLSKILSSI